MRTEAFQVDEQSGCVGVLFSYEPRACSSALNDKNSSERLWMIQAPTFSLPIVAPKH